MRKLYLMMLVPMVASAGGVYKCGTGYQATPCDGARVVQIREQTPEQKAVAAERLQAVRNEYDATKQARAEAAEKEFEKSMKMAEIQAAQQNVYQQSRQADALEQEAAKPVPFTLPPGFNQDIPPKR